MASVRFADMQLRPVEFLDFTSLTLDEFQQVVPHFETAFQAHMAAWRLDGAQLASGDKARTIRLWNAADGAPQGVIETPADTVLGLSYLPNNLQFVSAGSDGLARCCSCPRRR